MPRTSPDTLYENFSLVLNGTTSKLCCSFNALVSTTMVVTFEPLTVNFELSQSEQSCYRESCSFPVERSYLGWQRGKATNVVNYDIQALSKNSDVMPFKDTDTLNSVEILSLGGVPITKIALKIRKASR